MALAESPRHKFLIEGVVARLFHSGPGPFAVRKKETQVDSSPSTLNQPRVSTEIEPTLFPIDRILQEPLAPVTEVDLLPLLSDHLTDDIESLPGQVRQLNLLRS